MKIYLFWNSLLFPIYTSKEIEESSVIIDLFFNNVLHRAIWTKTELIALSFFRKIHAHIAILKFKTQKRLWSSFDSTTLTRISIYTTHCKVLIDISIIGFVCFSNYISCNKNDVYHHFSAEKVFRTREFTKRKGFFYRMNTLWFLP